MVRLWRLLSLLRKRPMNTHTIDAQGKKLGRISSQAAHLLQGKDVPLFERHELADVKVKIINVAGLDLSDRMDREYKRYSGYPGGLTRESAAHLIDRKGVAEIVRHAVSGMLPKNTHRSRLLKQLIIES